MTFQVHANPKPDRFTVEGEEVIIDVDSGGLNDRYIYIDSTLLTSTSGPYMTVSIRLRRWVMSGRSR